MMRSLVLGLLVFVLSGCTANNYTYHRDARPIIEAKCVGCHSEGDIAPFVLSSYEDVASAAKIVRASLEEGAMPPWPPGPDCNEFKHERSLEPQELEVLLGWLDRGAPEGNPDHYKPPQKVDEAILEFDVDLEIPTAYMPLNEPDDYRCFVIEWPEDARTYLTGFRFNPDQQDMVHHVVAFHGEPQEAQIYRDFDSAEEGPGYTCFGGPGASNQAGGDEARAAMLGTWVPGLRSMPTPKGTGIAIDPGSVIVLQMHYNTSYTQPSTDRSSVSLRLTDQVDRRAYSLLVTRYQWLFPGGMAIPPGEAEVTHEGDLDLWQLAGFLGLEERFLQSDRLAIHRGGLHMHQLGEAARMSVMHPDNSRTCLVDIPDWDFNWQGIYDFAEPKEISKEDRIHLRCTYDNSPENQPIIDGLKSEPQYTEWGDGTGDEMCIGVLYLTMPM